MPGVLSFRVPANDCEAPRDRPVPWAGLLLTTRFGWVVVATFLRMYFTTKVTRVFRLGFPLCVVAISAWSLCFAGCRTVAVPEDAASVVSGDTSIDRFLSLGAEERAAWLDAYRRELRPVLDHGLAELQRIFPEPEFNLIGRLKTAGSIEEKILRKRSEGKSYRWLHDVHDVIGLRLVIPSWAALPLAKGRVTSAFPVIKFEDLLHPLDHSAQYRAVHFDIRLQGHPAELQIHTARSALFAELSGELVYKGPYRDDERVRNYLADLGYALFVLDSGMEQDLPGIPKGLPPTLHDALSGMLAEFEQL